MAKILIIGGGVSGLSAGIYAQMNGHEAIICERGATAGGNLTGWQRGEYHIDNCIHWLTGTNPATGTYKMWETLGALGGVEIMQGDSLYTYDRDGESISLYRDLNKTEREMLSISPRDGSEIRSFISAVKIIQGLCGIAGENHNENIGVAQKVRSLPLLYKYYQMTTRELASRFHHPLLYGFIISFLGDDFGSLALLCIFAHFCGNNGGIPRGSSCGMANRMIEKFKMLGGNLILNKEANKINIKNGKAYSVSFCDGEEIGADYVIITCDPACVFGTLLDAPMPKRLSKLYYNYRMIRFSALHCAFSCDSDTLPFKGDIIFPVPFKYRGRLGAKNLIVREFSHEPSFAPSGKNIIQSLIFCDENRSARFIDLKKDKRAYKQEKNEIAKLICTIIQDKFPQLEGKLECIDVWTPATYKKYIGSEIGSFMSFAMPSKYIPLRIGNRISGLNNVLLATQWQQLPGGLPIAAEGGRLAIETVNKSEKKLAHKKTDKYSNIPSKA